MPAPPSQPPALPVRLGDFHRLGLVSDHPGPEVAAWLERVLGARPLAGTAALHDFWHPAPSTDPAGGGTSAESAARSWLWWIAGLPFAVFEATDDTSAVADFLRRYGPGPHSFAWCVNDLWTVEQLLRRADVRITGTDVPGRHFFMHPKDSGGILVEWTDTYLRDDPRDGGTLPAVAAPAVEVTHVAWTTAVVRDAARVAGVLHRLTGAQEIAGNPRADEDIEETVDLLVHDIVLRLIAPRSARSRHAEVLERRGERLYSVCWGVPDLRGAAHAFEDLGIGVVDEAPGRLWSDPATTLGLPFEWTEDSVVAPGAALEGPLPRTP
ncbi:VOC family protein [Pseudonocardia kunmingensis]|uniref:Glyoxalase/bleomycin resistance protein/dioxygenase superfamily protein n=1 Tax=Pseudonocardia kunmingensis TaxID=630975 RepID=A0A543DPF1_9PSEU|nr:VOC family protein [Pseudonocardia kunmingensis]TQM11189.1 glyoxalase/bleomycin resistance protein/dioxygenase superfamily protein [Pseudonocardia kunmingensis]